MLLIDAISNPCAASLRPLLDEQPRLPGPRRSFVSQAALLGPSGFRHADAGLKLDDLAAEVAQDVRPHLLRAGGQEDAGRQHGMAEQGAETPGRSRRAPGGPAAAGPSPQAGRCRVREPHAEGRRDVMPVSRSWQMEKPPMVHSRF